MLHPCLRPARFCARTKSALTDFFEQWLGQSEGDVHSTVGGCCRMAVVSTAEQGHYLCIST